MKQFLFFVQKEFYHVWRDKQTMFILFGLPIMQILIFGFALTNEVKNPRVAVLAPTRSFPSWKIFFSRSKGKS